jgi:hypothetical protein
MRATRAFLIAASALGALALSAAGGTTIVVNLGPFPDANAAAHGEAKVNWLDGETKEDTVCTENYAAVELQRYLRLATGRKGEFAIVDDDRAPGAGDWILVGGPDGNAAARRLAKRKDAAGTHLAEAERLAESLRKDTVSTKHSSSHANAANAFVATYATGALGRIRRRLAGQ